MNTTTHPVAPEEVMALLDGELSADHAQSVSAHIDQCAECQEVQATMRATSHKVAAWKVDAPQQLQEHPFLSNVQRIASKESQRRGFSWLPDILTRKRMWAPALALVVIFFAVVGAFTNRSTKSTSVDRAEVNRGVANAGDNAYFVHAIPFPASPPPPLGGPAGVRSAPMIARTVSLSIVVKDFDASRAALDAILARHNGYAANLNVSTPQGAARTLQASLRIPAPRLASAFAELKTLGRVEGETQNGEEVTQQHADLVARLKNSRETEQRLQDVLRTRTGKVKDVLEVEEEIARVRGEIEQMEAEQKTLEHRVDFATIDLKLAEEYKAQLSNPAPSVTFQLRNATVNGFRNAFESLLGMVLFLAESGPTLLLWLSILAVPAWMLWRRYRRAQSLGSLAERLS